MNQSILLTKAVAEDLDVGIARVEVPAPSGGYVVGNQINLTSFAILAQTTWNPGSIVDGGVSGILVTVPGASPGFPSIASISRGFETGLSIHCAVSAADQVVVTLVNDSGSTVVVNTVMLSVLVFPIPGV